LIAGALYLMAFRGSRRADTWRVPAVFGALTIVGLGAAMLPVLFALAPALFRIPTLVSVCHGVFVLVRIAQMRLEDEV
jgi:hypothetical protein